MLELNNVTMAYDTKRGLIKAVNNVSFSLKEGEIMGLVGESGCGKSATLLTVLGLVPYPGKVINGQILFQREDVLQKSPQELRRMRGKDVAMIFQDPMTTLNPVFTVGEQILETLRIHGLGGEDMAKPFSFWRHQRKSGEFERVLELMEEVGIPAPMARYKEYPHQFSGGMQQRALIAIALACNPKLLLADEPTTALDVTIQAQILELLREINRERGTAIIMVTHDLGMAAEFCQQIAVMYAGEIVEKGPTEVVLSQPKHPYTRGLLRSIPKIDSRREKIKPIPGTVADLAELGEECPFHYRCEEAVQRCREVKPDIYKTEPGHQVRCFCYGYGGKEGEDGCGATTIGSA